MFSSPKVTVGAFLKNATTRLSKAGITTARLDCLVLLEDILKTDRAHLLAHPEILLSSSQVHALTRLVARRAQHIPLAYVRHKTEFYGSEFYIDHHVLEPRPESETMINLLGTLQLPPKPTIVDVGTGSGALAITVKLRLPEAYVIGIDIDRSCLRIATQNMKRHNIDITFLQGDLLAPLASHGVHPDILLCNLPYVPDSFQINPAAMREPRIAIFGGHDGLSVYRKLFNQLEHVSRPFYIMTEAMPPQHGEITRIAKLSHYVLTLTDDFIQVFEQVN